MTNAKLTTIQAARVRYRTSSEGRAFFANAVMTDALRSIAEAPPSLDSSARMIARHALAIIAKEDAAVNRLIAQARQSTAAPAAPAQPARTPRTPARTADGTSPRQPKRGAKQAKRLLDRKVTRQHAKR